MSPKSQNLRAGFGAVALVMSKFVHPSKPISDKYPNWPKNHNLQGAVWVEVDTKVLRQGDNAILVLSSPILILLKQQFYTANRYIHMTKEGKEDSLFVLAEAVIPAVSSGAIGPLSVDENKCSDGAESNDAPILLFQTWIQCTSQ